MKNFTAEYYAQVAKNSKRIVVEIKGKPYTLADLVDGFSDSKYYGMGNHKTHGDARTRYLKSLGATPQETSDLEFTMLMVSIPEGFKESALREAGLLTTLN